MNIPSKSGGLEVPLLVFFIVSSTGLWRDFTAVRIMAVHQSVDKLLTRINSADELFSSPLHKFT